MGPTELGTWNDPHGVSATMGSALVATCEALTLNRLIVAVVPLLPTRAKTTLPSGCRRKKSSL